MNVIINGVNSDTINGLQILSLPPITKPRMRTSIATIDGRPGDIVTPLGYEAYNKTIKILLHDTYDLPAIMAYFNQSGTIIFSNDPDMVYTFETIEQINYERAVKFKTASVTIHVQPYKTSASEQPSEAESESFMDSEPYLFRASGDATMQIDEIVGGSVSFNQLCNAASVTVANGHKYFMKKGTAYSLGASTGTAITGLTSGSDMVIDLTHEFGPTIADYIYSLETSTAGAGVAWCKAYNPKMFSTYQPYNAGTLMSVNTSAHKTVGFNQWDGETEVGAINITTGLPSTSADNHRTKNFVPVLPNTTYCYTNPDAPTGIRLVFYDAEQNKIISLSNNNPNPQTFTTPTNAKYIKFYWGNISNACINLSDPQRNGQYEPYKTNSYPLDSSLTLRGIPKLDASNNLYYDGDIYPPSGEVKRRYGVVDLGTLTWTYVSQYETMVSDPMADRKLLTEVRCAKYTWTNRWISSSEWASSDKVVNSTGTSDTRIRIKDTAYTDATAFKTAMSGVYLVYELATPTTETADPYTNPQVVYPGGTEEYIDERTIPVPVGHNTKYLVPIEMTVTNSGNTDSAPSLTITGSGAIEVTIDGLIAFEINMPSTGQITIDAQAMDALDSDNNLANRNVFGDYSNLRLSPGSHTIIVNGDASSVSIGNASRWL